MKKEEKVFPIRADVLKRLRERSPDTGLARTRTGTKVHLYSGGGARSQCGLRVVARLTDDTRWKLCETCFGPAMLEEAAR